MVYHILMQKIILTKLTETHNLEYPDEILLAEKQGHSLAAHAKQFYFRYKQAEV